MSHFYISTIVQERRQDGGHSEYEVRQGDYPTLELAQARKIAEEAQWADYFVRNPHKVDYQSVMVNVINGFYGYSEKAGSNA